MPDNTDEFTEDAWRFFGAEPPKTAKQKPEPAPDNVVNISGTPHHTGTNPAYAAKALQDECEQLANTTTGRNHRLNVAAFNLAGFVQGGHLDRQKVIDALTAAAHQASQRGDHPLTDREIANTIESGFRGSHAKVGARNVPQQPTNVTDVDPQTITQKEPAPPAAGPETIFQAEQNFWNTRDSLTTIYNSALNRMCAPWAVLAHCAARALTQVRPCVTLPALIGGPGSLNWFAAIVAPSGGGKGSASAIARELVTDPIRERNMGSGEGIVGAFYRPGTKTEPPEQHEAVLFTADEIDTLTAMNNRSGSTTMSILRSGFAGETLGFSYVTRGRDIHLDAHSYRMTLVVSVQPSRAAGLMSDGGGGTPQRFMWFPGIDMRISDTPQDTTINPLALPAPGEWLYPRTIKIPDEARNLILTERAKASRGQLDALDGHAMFCREKFAYALALLDNRIDMNDEDWRLSGIAAEISTRTRTWVSEQLASAADVEAEQRGRLLGVTYSASDDEKAYRAAKKAQRIARWVLEKLDGGPMTQREITHAIAGRDRTWLQGALESLESSGLITHEEGERDSASGGTKSVLWKRVK